jgi:DNA-binding response OmpR family regulator
MPATPAVLAIFNTSEDTTDLLRHVFERAGFVVVTAFTNVFRDGKVDFEAFMRQHRPSLIVYDIAIPYEENWRLYEHFRDSPACRGLAFVCTIWSSSWAP